MIRTPLNTDKRHLIEYLLSRYQFKSRISVWLLNFIKSDETLLRHLRFVDQVITGCPTLEIAVIESPSTAIHYHNESCSIINSNEIFHHVIHHSYPLDIKIHFNPTQQRDHRMDQFLLHQLLSFQSESHDLKISDAFTFSKRTELQLIRMIESQIDLSLNLKDVHAFQHFSNLLNFIKFRQ
ncbi:YpiB family protein [Staphylococcus lutrae]|uniref:UPF0302 domain-containing protein n=2 Tax=Staphylococcus lutrae TaxID=155085 RepID=A0AAC9RQF0_9STAP|nr:YpiB family protein [Staphylococcus lutrae]ARJ51876.1 hypothetical protein B5P37_11375 [Staphylococcus lutrae]PNZ35940.1 hypothetical protein CD134_08655 [Staphylococcus lutrae]